MGTCLQTGRTKADTVDANDICNNKDAQKKNDCDQIHDNNISNPSHSTQNTNPSTNTILKNANISIAISREKQTENNNNGHLIIKTTSPHHCAFKNSSSVDSLTIDGPMPPLQQIPSFSSNSTTNINTTTPKTNYTKSRRTTHKKPSIPLQPINDNKSTDMVIVQYDDIDPEIDDELHVTQYSDEALEAIKSSSGSHDNISDETDDIDVMNNDLNKSQQSNINGKEEYDSDDTKQETSDQGDDTDSTDIETEEDDIEPTPLSLYVLFRV